MNLLKILNPQIFVLTHKVRCDNEFSTYEILCNLQEQIRYARLPPSIFTFPCNDDFRFSFSYVETKIYIGKREMFYKYSGLTPETTMMQKRYQEFIVKYSINYPSGKKWITQKSVYAYSEVDAKNDIKWLRSGHNISIISIIPTYKTI